MISTAAIPLDDLAQRLAEAEATVEALLSGEIDAVIDPRSHTPVLLSKAQNALRASEDRYRRIVETANEGIWTVDEHGHTTFANARLAAMLGYSVEEMTGMPMSALVAVGDRANAAADIARIREGSSVESEGRLLRRDGTEIPVSISAAPSYDAEGSYRGSLAMVTDRTQHRAAAEALRRSEEKYRQIVDGTRDGIVTVDTAGMITFANAQFAEMLGYDFPDLLGCDCLTLMAPESRAAASGAFWRVQSGQQDASDYVLIGRDGGEVQVCITGSPVRDSTGAVVASLGMVRDVSETRRLHSQLLVSERMASMGTLAAGMAHEINNPLAALVANLAYIADVLALRAGGAEAATPPNAGFLELIMPALDDAREAAQRVQSTVRDLKQFSRASDEEQISLVNVTEVLETTLRMANNEIRHRCRLVTDFAQLPYVNASAARLGQVFLNLVVNAAQAMEEGGVEENLLRVTTRVDEGRIIIAVSDTGPGIGPALLDRVFDPFFTSKVIGGGTGLGLTISQRIVTDLGGELTVKSRVGTGTTFVVSLPVSLHQVAPLSLPSVPGSTELRGRILVVDDEAIVVRVLQRLLGDAHEVQAVTSAGEALDLFRAGERFDVILCDLMMPVMSGMELHRELERLAPEQSARMIFVTGGVFTEDAQRFLDATKGNYLEKPFDAAGLRALVQRRLDDSPRGHAGLGAG